MPSPLRIVQYGLGPIGQATARSVLEKSTSERVRLAGAIDIDPDKVGRDVADLIGLDASCGVTVSDDAEGVLAETAPDVVLHTTTSFLDEMHEQLRTCARAGAHVVSSTEELAYPYDRHPDLADDLDATAREHGVTVVGTGVNPGYAMDTLALTATGVCQDVQQISVERLVNAGARRGPLQEKVGAGLSADAFAEKKATGTFGHIGLRESLLMLADGLGWSFDQIDERLDPVIAEKSVETPHAAVARDEVAGIHHTITGHVDSELLLSLDLKMYVGAREEHDRVHVEGNPPVDLKIRGGIFGDTATVAMLVNTAPLAAEARSGLHTMKDLPVPRAFATR
jgi:4-hydroxy-tetrahydrodipicolinate reductase